MILVRNLDVREINTALLSLQNLLRNGGKSGSGNIYNTYNNSTNNMNDVPVGTICSYLGTSDPVDGNWLICDGRDTSGTAIELETYYPSLYMFLGASNVLPYIVDRNSPLDYTRMVSRNVGGSSTDTWTATDSGLVVAPFVGFNGAYGYLSVNNVIITRASTPNNQVAAQSGAGSVFVEKGDIIKVCNNYHTVANTWSFIPFSKYKIIKATSSSDSYHVPNQEVVQIEQYFDEGLQRTQSYSTTETLTGGTWIDGKPIYRKVIENNTVSGSGWQTLISSGFESVKTMVKIYGILYTNDGYIISLPWGETSYAISVRFNTTNKKIYIKMESTAFYNRPYKLVFEYTKTTD